MSANIGCHVIQRERPQPLPAISGVAPSRPAAASALPMRLDDPWSSEHQAPASSVRGGPDGLGGWRKRGNRYLVLATGRRLQGGKTVDTPDEARDLAAENAGDAPWDTGENDAAGDACSVDGQNDGGRCGPLTLTAAEPRWRELKGPAASCLPWFGDRPIEHISPADIRRWQAEPAAKVGRDLLACRSICIRILQLAEDEAPFASNPVRKVPPPKRRADPSSCWGRPSAAPTRRRSRPTTRLHALSWWDDVLVFLGTGLRFGELAGCAAAGSASTSRARAPGRRGALPGGSQSVAASKAAQERRRHPGAPAPRWSWSRSAEQLPPEADPGCLSSPAGWRQRGPPARGRCCRGTASAASTERAVAAPAMTCCGRPHGPDDLRHTFSTWLEDAGIPRG